MIEQIEIVRAHFMMQPLCAIMTYNKIKIPQPDSTDVVYFIIEKYEVHVLAVLHGRQDNEIVKQRLP